MTYEGGLALRVWEFFRERVNGRGLITFPYCLCCSHEVTAVALFAAHITAFRAGSVCPAPSTRPDASSPRVLGSAHLG